MKAKLALEDNGLYKYLSGGVGLASDKDAKGWESTLQCLKNVGMEEQSVVDLMRITAAVLHLGMYLDHMNIFILIHTQHINISINSQPKSLILNRQHTI